MVRKTGHAMARCVEWRFALEILLESNKRSSFPSGGAESFLLFLMDWHLRAAGPHLNY